MRLDRSERLNLARGCRLVQRSEVGSYLGYTDRDGSLLGAAAPDPEQKWPSGSARNLPS